MERRSFLAVALAALVLRKLPKRELLVMPRAHIKTTLYSLHDGEKVVYLNTKFDRKFNLGFKVSQKFFKDDLYGAFRG